jgi:hypothetical protein
MIARPGIVVYVIYDAMFNGVEVYIGKALL